MNWIKITETPVPDFKIKRYIVAGCKKGKPFITSALRIQGEWASDGDGHLPSEFTHYAKYEELPAPTETERSGKDNDENKCADNRA